MVISSIHILLRIEHEDIERQNKLKHQCKKKEKCKDVDDVTFRVPLPLQSDKAFVEWPPKQHKWFKIATM